MKKHTILATLTLLTLVIAFSISTAFAGYNNQNDDLPFAGKSVDRGTNKASNQLPDQSNVPWPAGLVEDIFGPPDTPYVVEGCRARGATILVSVPGQPEPFPGGPCCKGPEITEGLYAPNQCCNPPDILYPQEMYTPGNHCLCFAMRMPEP